MYEREIEEKIQELPEDLKKEVLDYLVLLLKKYKDRESQVKPLLFDWEGGLAELKDKFTAVELQHKAMEWR